MCRYIPKIGYIDFIIPKPKKTKREASMRMRINCDAFKWMFSVVFYYFVFENLCYILINLQIQCTLFHKSNLMFKGNSNAHCITVVHGFIHNSYWLLLFFLLKYTKNNGYFLLWLTVYFLKLYMLIKNITNIWKYCILNLCPLSSHPSPNLLKKLCFMFKIYLRSVWWV